MNFSDRLEALRAVAESRCTPLVGDHPGYTCIFSLSDGEERAEVVHASGAAFKDAWRQGLIALRRRMDLRKLKGRMLRVDWVTEAVPLKWLEFESQVEQCRRNYFRYGLALDRGFKLLFTEQECNAQQIYYLDRQVSTGTFNAKRFTAYAAKRFGGVEAPCGPSQPVWRVATAGAWCDADGSVAFIPPPRESGPPVRAGLYTGHREIPHLTAALCRELVRKSAHWLARQIQPSGKYVYGYFPSFDRRINTYNALRHASSTYALLEAAQYLEDEALQAQAHRALAYCVQKLVRQYEPEPGKPMAFLVDDVSEEIKLGGNGVTLLALSKWMELTGSRDYVELAELLAQGIVHIQQPAGGFVHVLHSADLSLKAPFRVIYYDGEAVFGLLRLYQQTGNPQWLAVAQKAFDSFLDDEHTKAHDHWLSYSVNEITRYYPEEKYFRFGIHNFSSYLSFIQNRETTFPTLLELMMAAQKMLQRMKSLPEMGDLLASVDRKRFEQARDARALSLTNGFFWPEMAMYFQSPQRITDAFFIRHHSFRCRIDDAEHYISGLIAYAQFLENQS